MLNVVDKAPRISINKKKCLLLIPSRFPPIRLYRRIGEFYDDEIANIETLTNPRIQEKQRLTQGRGAAMTNEHRFQNWNHAPFVYPNPEGTRYFGPDITCLELSFEIQTALAVSVVKRETFLSRTSESPLDLDMRALIRPVRGQFIDGREWPLHLSQEKRWSLGREILNTNVDGLIFHSPERPSGIRITILNVKPLGRAIQGNHYRYIWNGSRISSIYSFNDGLEIDPCKLSEDTTIMAA